MPSYDSNRETLPIFSQKLLDHITWATTRSPETPRSLLLPLYVSIGATGPESGLSRMSFELFEDA